MELLDIMKQRHSVRQYQNKKIEENIRAELEACLAECNEESGLHMQIIYDEPQCFSTMMARYGKFSGVTNYIALVGKNTETLEETVGYYGEKLVCVISLGYGQTQGVPHKNKELKQVCNQEENQPDWFVKGVKAALLAPTAMNQQKYHFEAISGYKIK